MNTEKKRVWIDQDTKVLAFHKFNGSVMYTREQSEFWDWVIKLVRSGYKMM